MMSPGTVALSFATKLMRMRLATVCLRADEVRDQDSQNTAAPGYVEDLSSEVCELKSAYRSEDWFCGTVRRATQAPSTLAILEGWKIV